MGSAVYFFIPMAVVALLLAVAGTAALTSGWLLPRQRKHIVRTRLFGWAQLLIAAALGVQSAGLLPAGSSYQSLFIMPGAVGLLFGLVLITRAQRPSPSGRPG
ncbi:hypothetical protein [Streptomyces sp. NPDC091371]|uniref:hypothetical protein n=1 Tax=Streptomyces sp. NPDC091371 TaxID=3155303 RepID=UPI0034240452